MKNNNVYDKILLGEIYCGNEAIKIVKKRMNKKKIMIIRIITTIAFILIIVGGVGYFCKKVAAKPIKVPLEIGTLDLIAK